MAASGEYRDEENILKKYKKQKQAIENMKKRMAWMSATPAKNTEAEREKLQREISAKEGWCSLIEDVLDQIDPMNRAVIEKLFTGKDSGSMKQLCIDMYVSRNTGYKWRQAALKEFAQLWGTKPM